MDQAEHHVESLMPGYTHLQTAQPVTFGHHLMAYVEMFGRDRGRFADARQRLNLSPLGAAALAGTSFPIDRHMTASAMGLMGQWRIQWMRYLPVILPWNIWPPPPLTLPICRG